jgi:hypothetical protein
MIVGAPLVRLSKLGISVIKLPTGAKAFARVLAIAVIAVPFAACTPTMYNDNTLHEIPAGQYQPVANPKPVQFLFDFQTKGATNSRARDQVQPMVAEVLKDSLLFSSVSADPQPNGAILQVTINNVPLDDNAFAKGFAVGLTLGIAGATVGDGYICTVQYSAGPNATPISKEVRDAIYGSLGATASAPPHADKAASIMDAINRMARQCVGNALDQLARDPAFPK